MVRKHSLRDTPSFGCFLLQFPAPALALFAERLLEAVELLLLRRRRIILYQSDGIIATLDRHTLFSRPLTAQFTGLFARLGGLTPGFGSLSVGFGSLSEHLVVAFTTYGDVR